MIQNRPWPSLGWGIVTLFLVGASAIAILIGILILVFLVTFTLPHLIFPFLSLGLLAKLYIAICTPIFGIFIFRNLLSLEL